MMFGTFCSGIGAPECAWVPMGWTPVFHSEIEKFPCEVFDTWYPNSTQLGDMTALTDKDLEQYAGRIDVICGGTPCQSFSVGGLRDGLADARGRLTQKFLRITNVIRPEWVVWENVPGALSSNGGRDFGAILGALAELGYGFAYRVCDVQNGAPRKHLVVVANTRGWRRAAAVLFEQQDDSDSGKRSRKGTRFHRITRTNAGSRNARGNIIDTGNGLRAMTPLECERALGFPDNYTAIPGASDSARYKAIGNSMAVPVMRWIGERIEMVNAL